MWAQGVRNNSTTIIIHPGLTESRNPQMNAVIDEEIRSLEMTIDWFQLPLRFRPISTHSNRPVRHLQRFHTLELAQIVRHQRQALAACVSCDVQVIDSDRLAP